jgi:transposase-like protein
MPFRVRRVTAFPIDETYVRVGKAEAWVAIDPIHRFILGVYLSRHRNMAEAFLRSLEVWKACSI